MSHARPKFSGTVDLVNLQRQARMVGCTLITNEALRDFSKQHKRLRDAETRLGNLAALRIVAERKTLRGWFARRWIARVQGAVDLLQEGMSMDYRLGPGPTWETCEEGRNLSVGGDPE